MKVGTVFANMKIKVKLTLWSAIKLRIAGLKNIVEETIETSLEINKEKE